MNIADDLKRACEKLQTLSPFELEEGDGCPFCGGWHPDHDNTCKLQDYEEAMNLLGRVQEGLAKNPSYTPTVFPPHRVTTEAIFLEWKGQSVRIPNTSPQYDPARFAIYACEWDEVLRIANLNS